MPSERVQRQIDHLLSEAESAIAQEEWATVAARARAALRLDAANEDARSYLDAANHPSDTTVISTTSDETGSLSSSAPPPTAFAKGRYEVKRFLGEGGKKKVYLAHDSLLDRDVAFALIKTEGLDDAGRVRIQREAQAMGRLGAHPHIVSVFDLGAEGEQPFIVTELMGGGDVEGLIEKAEEHRLPLERVIEIGVETCQGLEFAHEKGIVHRDLKPGNVWLTSDGRAKIGDFGLAMAIDRSRLTQAGMMVGTVSYMPPEQALGGEVTAQSDLYSLGAMLYEMVCGRPPFVGDDYVAIISQHLNTPPVAPSWHRSDLPPGFESLMLLLLEKDPKKRPGSAEEVRHALQRLDLSAPIAAVSEANPIERVARGVFVGRERELQRLRQAWDEASAGRGGVVMLVGEPGIGKTRTAQELETYARIRGGQVLWGRAHEAAGAPSYWPWVQAIRSYTVATPPEALRAQLGSGAVEVARIVSEIRERLPDVPEPQPTSDPEQAQFRLFDAVSSFLRNACTSTPLLIVLDDLHWADRPTLLLFQHLAGEIGRSRLLLVGNYRDVEVGRHHPLAEVLAELNRESLFQRVLLRGLSREEVEQYIKASAAFDPARGLLESIYQETEGNPFFLSEVVALMAQEGTLGVRGGASVPQGVREVLGRRLDRLSPQCNELLDLAAIIGREFSYELLTALSEIEDERLLELVEESLKGRVVDETDRPGDYRFSHALIQETLLGELSTTRRVRLHGRVAEVLEKHYADQSDRHAAELALHFSESATLTRSHARQAAYYSRLAAEQAEADSGWGEAARLYRRALALIEETREDLGQDEAHLLVALAGCEWLLRELETSLGHFLRAIANYRERGDGAAMAKVVTATVSAQAFTIGLPRAEAVHLGEEALGLLGDGDAYLNASLLARLGIWTNDESRLREARELAETHGYRDVLGVLLVYDAQRMMARGDSEGATVAAQRAREIWEQLENRERINASLLTLTLARSFHSLDEGEAAAREGLAKAREFHIRTSELGMSVVLEAIAFLCGDLSETPSPVAEVSPASPGLQSGPMALALRSLREEAKGDFDQALALVPSWTNLPGSLTKAAVLATITRVQFNAGDTQAAGQGLAQWQEAFRSISEPLYHCASAVWLDDALPSLATDQLVRDVYEDLIALPSVRVHVLPMPIGFDHVRGALALRLGLVKEAEAHYRTGLDWAEQQRAVIEEGRCLQGLAAVAEQRGDKQAQAGYLDRAATIFQRIGANLYLKQVLAKKEVLKA